MRGTLGGRTNVSRMAAPIAALPKLGVAEVGTPCQIETFNGANTTGMGPDLTWAEYHASGAVPRRVSNELTVSRASGGAGITFIGRADSDVGGVDMQTKITVTGVGTLGTTSGTFGSYSYVVDARMEPEFSPGDMAAGLYTGWQFFYTNYKSSPDSGSAQLELYLDPSSPAYHFYDFVDLLPLLVDGDELSIAVTGTGTSTHVVCTHNTSTIFDVSGGTLTAWLASESISASDLPVGQRGGCGMFATLTPNTWDAGNDNVLALDQFEACIS